MQRVTGFDHRPGRHCGSTSLRNLAEFYDWGYAEPACFGLGEGLGFNYFELDDSPWRGFVGRSPWLERSFFDNLDISYTYSQGDDWETAWGDVTSRLDDDQPVMLFVDLYHLDYYDTETHFAPHAVVAMGYGDDRVLLSDSEFDEPQELPLDSLRQAWSSDYMMDLENWHLAVTDPQPGNDEDVAANRALRRTTRYMLDPGKCEWTFGAFGQHGIPAMRTFADELPNWTDLPDPQWAARFAHQNVDKRGTGGGAFRGLYADALDLLAGDAGIEGTQARHMDELADEWSDVGAVLREASEADDEELLEAKLEEAASHVAELADREEAFFQHVREELD